MTQNTERSPVSSHTEYVRSRVRCPNCGEYVTTDGTPGTRCSNCV